MIRASTTQSYSLCSPFTSNANPPPYAARNEQGFLTPGIFSCNSFSICSSPLTNARNAMAWLT